MYYILPLCEIIC